MSRLIPARIMDAVESERIDRLEALVIELATDKGDRSPEQIIKDWRGQCAMDDEEAERDYSGTSGHRCVDPEDEGCDVYLASGCRCIRDAGHSGPHLAPTRENRSLDKKSCGVINWHGRHEWTATEQQPWGEPGVTYICGGRRPSDDPDTGVGKPFS